jgi:lipoate-protein ligase A
MKDWFLLVDEVPHKGSLNMAVDEHLLNSLMNRPRTFLRFYQWQRPTASLGCSQKAENVLDLEFCRANGIDVVRRMTGGKMVLHHQEITYSIASSDQELFTTTLGGSYKRISQALVRGLEKMGLKAALADKAPPFYARGTMPCFSLPAQDEIEIGGLKIVGSAQKRTGGRFLQHGSIPLAYDEELLRSVSLYKGEGGIRMTSLGRELGRDVDFAWAVEKLLAGFEAFFGVALRPLELAPSDWEAVRALEARKYAHSAWTFEGRDAAEPSQPR